MEMSDLEQPRKHLAEIDQQIAELERETHDRIERYANYNMDQRRMRREEWSRFEDQVRPMREEREYIAKTIANIVALQAPPPVVIQR